MKEDYSGVKGRQRKAKERLEAQLSKGTKNFGNHISGGTVPLTERDISRINAEIAKLKSKGV